MLKFWDAEMKLDRNYQVNASSFCGKKKIGLIALQNFPGHSEPVRKMFFTHDNMQLISIGDSICIWDVLAWTTPQVEQPE